MDRSFESMTDRTNRKHQLMTIDCRDRFIILFNLLVEKRKNGADGNGNVSVNCESLYFKSHTCRTDIPSFVFLMLP